MKKFSLRSGLSSLMLVSAVFAAPAAFAEGGNPIGRINLVGDLNYNVYSQDFSSNSVNYHGKGDIGYGGGVLLDFGAANAVGLETGAIWFKRKINVDFAQGNTSNLVFGGGDMNVVHVPVDILFGMNDIVSIVGGVFDEFPTSSGYSNNLGVGGGIRFNIPAGAGSTFLVDLRYNHGFSDQGIEGAGFHTNDFHLLVGIGFGGT